MTNIMLHISQAYFKVVQVNIYGPIGLNCRHSSKRLLFYKAMEMSCFCPPDPRVVKEDGHIETPAGRKLCDMTKKDSKINRIDTWKDPHWGGTMLSKI